MRYLWLLLVASSLALGAWSLCGRIAARVQVPVSPRASTNALLAFLKLENGAESLREALAKIPEEDAVVFVAPAEDPMHKEILFTVSLLALPHQMGGLGCLEEGASEMIVPLNTDQKITAAVFFRWEAKAASTERLASELALLRIPPQAADRPWPSFCSSPPPPSS